METLRSLRMLLASAVLLASQVAAAAAPSVTVLFTGDNTGEIEPCG
ncbi:MAG: hypothetical protein ACK4N5_09120 [Myxococcales bacterium]